MLQFESVERVLLIDGNSLFHRAYHALPPLTDRHGEMANAVFGFSNMLIKAIYEVNPDYIACAFDTQAPTFRHVEFEKYKAQRAAPPPDLYPQLPKVKKILEAFGIAYFEKEGYEADDLLATIANRAIVDQREHSRSVSKVKARLHSGSEVKGSDINVVILSGDRDVLQLVNDNVKVQMPGWNLKETTLYGSKEVKAKYGLEPHQMVDYKSLTGDPSDNIPGITGIGPKTASALLQKYHTLENLFRHAKETPLRIREKLEAGKNIALAAKRLVELDRHVDLPLMINGLRFNPDWHKVTEEYEDLGFKSIVAKLRPSGDGVVRSSNSQEEKKSAKLKSRGLDQLKLV